MICPHCGHNKSHNPIVKPAPEKYKLPDSCMYRRRSCSNCGESYGTVEIEIGQYEYLATQGGERALQEILELIETHKSISEIV